VCGRASRLEFGRTAHKAWSRLKSLGRPADDLRWPWSFAEPSAGDSTGRLRRRLWFFIARSSDIAAEVEREGECVLHGRRRGLLPLRQRGCAALA
jgi:hypothetical protein